MADKRIGQLEINNGESDFQEIAKEERTGRGEELSTKINLQQSLRLTSSFSLEFWNLHGNNFKCKWIKCSIHNTLSQQPGEQKRFTYFVQNINMPCIFLESFLGKSNHGQQLKFCESDQLSHLQMKNLIQIIYLTQVLITSWGRNKEKS